MPVSRNNLNGPSPSPTSRSQSWYDELRHLDRDYPWIAEPPPPLNIRLDLIPSPNDLQYSYDKQEYTVTVKGYIYRMTNDDMHRQGNQPDGFIFTLVGKKYKPECYPSYYDYEKEERKNNDMFASRKDEEDNTIRLCIRRGRVIRSTVIDGVPKKITFRTPAIAKQCSDELNEKYFDTYDNYMDRDNNLRNPGVFPPEDLRKGMVEVIAKYATLEDEVIGNSIG